MDLDSGKDEPDEKRRTEMHAGLGFTTCKRLNIQEVKEVRLCVPPSMKQWRLCVQKALVSWTWPIDI
jgi:hypothetical protein